MVVEQAVVDETVVRQEANQVVVQQEVDEAVVEQAVTKKQEVAIEPERPWRSQELFEVAGDGEPRANGKYRLKGYHANRGRYERIDDHSVQIYYSESRGAWCLVVEPAILVRPKDRRGVTLYEVRANDTFFPTTGWVTVDGTGPAPRFIGLVGDSFHDHEPRPAATCNTTNILGKWLRWRSIIGDNKCHPVTEVECGVAFWCGKIPGLRMPIKACVKQIHDSEHACKVFEGSIKELARYSTPHRLRSITITPSIFSWGYSFDTYMPQLLHASPRVQELDFTRLKIGMKGASAIKQVLPELIMLHTLQVRGTDIGETGIQEIAQMAPFMPSLQRLGPLASAENRFQLSEYVAELLAYGFRNPQVFTSFKPVEENGTLSDEHMKELAPWLGHLAHLQELDFTGSKFGARGAGLVAPSIGRLGQLRKLSFHKVPLGTAGLRNFAKILEHLGALKEMDLRDTGVGARGVAEVAPTLSRLQPTFQELAVTPRDLQGCSEAGKLKLVKRLANLSAQQSSSSLAPVPADIETFFACMGSAAEGETAEARAGIGASEAAT